MTRQYQSDVSKVTVIQFVLHQMDVDISSAFTAVVSIDELYISQVKSSRQCYKRGEIWARRRPRRALPTWCGRYPSGWSAPNNKPVRRGQEMITSQHVLRWFVYQLLLYCHICSTSITGLISNFYKLFVFFQTKSVVFVKSFVKVK